MPAMRFIPLTLAILIAATSAHPHVTPHRSAAELKDVLKFNRETIGGPFTLVDGQGRQRSDTEFRGKLLLVYFGYTSCPDVCPTDLAQIGAAIDALGPAGDAVQPLFITLDPARDTPRVLAGYVHNFHPRLVGLGGSASAIQRTADAYRVFARKVPIGRKGDYGFDHAANTYLMDREGKYLGFFPPGTSAARMAEIIRTHL
jgi:protein SCO1/2